MATINFLLKSESERASIIVRFTANRKIDFQRKTGFIINPKNWDYKKGCPTTKSDTLKKLKIQLNQLEIHIENRYNIEQNEGKVINGQWLQNTIDVFNNKEVEDNLELLTNCIEKYIENAPNMPNQKKGLGLSERRVKSLVTFKNLIIRYEKEFLKGRQIRIKEVNIEFADNYIKWLNSKNYTPGYVFKNIDNLKCICNYAERKGLEVSYQLKSIKSYSETKSPEQIFYLSESELNQIKQAEISSEHLDNARKWLLFGCQIGQRAGDLLSIKESDVKTDGEFRDIFAVVQQKTGKIVSIPLLKETKEIISTGFPRTISFTKFNKYIKNVCEIAGINQLVLGRVKEHSRGLTKTVYLPKYKIISTHVCRRSFATNFYNKNKFPTSMLMGITGHSTEKLFLKYIGRTSEDNARMMIQLSEGLIQKN